MVRSARTYRLLLCGGLAALIYLTGLGRPALWEPDEGRYAEVAREMVASGDYLTPRNNWVRYFEKPPLVYWTTAAALRIFGPNEFAVRFQSAAFSVAQVVVTDALGETMFGATAGILGALALALSPLFFGFARFATPDPALAFFLTAALAAFYAGARTAGLRIGRGRNWMLLASAMLALATLAKGPVALFLGGGVALFSLVVESRAGDVLRVPWLEGAAIYLAIVLPWFVVVSLRNPGFLQFFLVHEHLQRYLESTEHGWGPWFFVPVVAGGTWPWLYFVPRGLATLWRINSNDNADASERAALRLLLVWFGVIFIFFSIPRSKLGEYILPAIPPVAIIAGHGLATLTDSPAPARRRLFLGFAVANLAIAVAVVITALVAIARGANPTLATAAIAAAAAIFIGAASAYLSARYLRASLVPVFSTSIGVLVALTIGIKARSDAAPLVSYRELARTIDPYVRAGCILASYGHFVQALPFYLRTREKLVDYRGELAPFSQGPDAVASFIPSDADLRALWRSQCVLLIVNRNDLSRLARMLDPRPQIVGCEGKKLALCSRTFPKSGMAATVQCGDSEKPAQRK
jgi:4-amino-4-deoxy-L-arabinose transferase-like glycosyltransferase